MKSHILATIRTRLEYLVVILLATVLVAVMVSIFRTPEFEGRARLLVIQKQDKIDAFSASKSADYIAGLLNEAVYTDSFFTSIAAKDAGFAATFDPNPEERAKEWNKKIDTNVVNDKGIITIKAYDEDSNQAKHIADLVTSVLVSEGATYHGGGSDITLRVVDVPTVSEKPVRPDILVNTLAGFFLGLALCVVYLLFVETKMRPKLEDVEYAHPEFEREKDDDFLADGHYAAEPSRHVVSESFDTVEPAVPFIEEQAIQQNLNSAYQPQNRVPKPSAPDASAHDRIQNWMQN